MTYVYVTILLLNDVCITILNDVCITILTLNDVYITIMTLHDLSQKLLFAIIAHCIYIQAGYLTENIMIRKLSYLMYLYYAIIGVGSCV